MIIYSVKAHTHLIHSKEMERVKKSPPRLLYCHQTDIDILFILQSSRISIDMTGERQGSTIIRVKGTSFDFTNTKKKVFNGSQVPGGTIRTLRSRTDGTLFA